VEKHCDETNTKGEMSTRNCEEITLAREEEFSALHELLENTLSKHSRVGIDKSCGIWIPEDNGNFRDFYVVLANSALLTRDLFADIRKVLATAKFIWVVIIHVAAGNHDDRVAELTRTETVVFENSPFYWYLKGLLS
jgi:hypothetical protein